MAHPKTRVSKQRKHKRRTHYKVGVPQIATCKTTGQRHLLHRAYKDDEGNMFYRGKLMIAAEGTE